jgi:HD-GYP domain-containing protein (c-di-GMP phosphodiesterase class II)/predicted MFS family arabinose efflux permease
MLLYLAVGTQIAALLPIRWRNGVQSVVDPLLLAAGLYAPGAGVGLLAWVATFDGRVPGRGTTWWILAFNRAMLCIAHAFPSLVVAYIAPNSPWNLPIKTGAYVLMSVALNYLMAARALSFVSRTSFWATLEQNVGGLPTLTSTAILNFSGGILYLVLAKTPDNIGYLMAPALFGFILAVRGNVADAQRQTELKDQTLELAAQALDARDRYTESHSIRVAELSGRLGEHLELGNRECDLLRTAGSLHDLGKIGVRDDILNKPGPLTDEEWDAMRKHPDIGADMIAQHSALTAVAPLVRHHHERWDGSGYPAGLKGDVIPFGARILSVADSFDTITGTRLYRRSLMTPLEGVEDISRRAGHWYDPNVVDALRALHGMEPLDLADRPHVPRRITEWNVLRSNPGFARLLAAIAISGLGDPLTQVAALVSIYAATHGDTRAVAVAFIAQAVATILMSVALGGIADRFPRKRLVVYLELARSALLIATPFLVASSIWMMVPVLFVLAAINSVVAPAKQAAVPTLVGPGQVGKANSMVTATMTGCGALGFGLAGVILALAQQSEIPHPTTVLFIADALTFAVAALLVARIPNLGGGAATMRVTGAWRRAWALNAARAHLTVAAAAGFLLAMSFPALLALAYRIEPKAGGPTYSALELVLSAGIFIGSLVVGRSQVIGSMRTAGFGLMVTGLFSLAITLTNEVYIVAAALFVASLGNAIYWVANQTALVEAADASNRGSMMATRFSLVQTASIAGAALGGFVTQAYGPLVAYGMLAIGLILLGMFALAAGRRTTNPLHGLEYEEAMLWPAGASSPAE